MKLFYFNSSIFYFSCSELVTVDGRGSIRAFRQLNSDVGELHHESSLRSYYPREVTHVKYVKSHGIILVAGELYIGSDLNVNVSCGI